MLDLSHIDDMGGRVQIFYGNMTTNIALNQVWVKERGITMVDILAIGQGGNGTNGVVGATAAGGAGGGSGAQSRLTIPARLIPDILYIGSGSGSTIAVSTIIAARPHGATYNSIPLAQDTYLVAGGAGTSSGGAIGSVATAILSGRGTATFLAGLAGGTAGAVTPTAGGAPASNASGLMVSSGGGGGGMSAAAATAGGAGFTTALQTGYAGATGGAAGTSGVAGGNGQNAINDIMRMIFGGGGGGGAGFPTATASAGGSGGAGGYGSGGGGGGGAVTGQAAGTGGKGGQGLVIITCW